MPENQFPTGDALDRAAAPFYHALGRAFTRWQHVEAALFDLAHALMGTDYKISPTVFFHIKSADSKVELIDRLCAAHFEAAILEKEWKPLRKRIRTGLDRRNDMAHFEVNFITDPKFLARGGPPIVLSPHHLDHRAMAKGEVPAASAEALDSWGITYLELARETLRFVSRHFPIEKLRQTNLPPNHVQILERYRGDPEGSQLPPEPSSV